MADGQRLPAAGRVKEGRGTGPVSQTAAPSRTEYDPDVWWLMRHTEQHLAKGDHLQASEKAWGRSRTS